MERAGWGRKTMGNKGNFGRGRRLLWGVALLTLAATTCGCGASSGQRLPEVEIEDYQRLTYEPYVVKKKQIDPVVTLNLESTTIEEKKYYPMGDSVELAEVCVRVGDIVSEGDVLFRYESGDLENQIKEYEGRIASNKMLYEHYEKMQEIDPNDGMAATLEQLAGSIRVDELYIAELRDRMKSNCVYAEGNGLVNFVMSDAENHKLSGDQILMKITYSDGQYFAYSYDELYLEEGKNYEYSSGVTNLLFMYKKMEKVEDQYRYLFQYVPTEQNFCTRSIVQMDIAQPTMEASINVPEEYVAQAEDGYYVFLLNEDNRIRAKKVQVAEIVNGNAIITSGLEEGEQVVRR